MDVRREIVGPDEPPPPKGVRRVNYRRLYPDDNNFWWIEYGGNLDTVGDANAIQEELKKIAHGVWAYMKNHPDGRAREYDLDCLYSVNVPNLMFAGRDISCTHMGLSATRVMGTCAALGQAVGTAAALQLKYGIDPAQLRRERIAELQDMIEDDDCMLPYRWRKVSALTAAVTCTENVAALRNGIDRSYGGRDNGVWVAPNETTMAYSWDSPQCLSGARLVFDSEMTHRGKRMRKLEATTERAEMPKMLAKAFRIEARIGGEWRCVFSDDLNILRFRKVSFAPVEPDALRLVVTETWGSGKAHVFAFDAL